MKKILAYMVKPQQLTILVGLLNELLMRERKPTPIREGQASRVIFFYWGEEGTYIDNAKVRLYESGAVHIETAHEEVTTHLQNCEILWKYEIDQESRLGKLRVLKSKTESKSKPGGTETNLTE